MSVIRVRCALQNGEHMTVLCAPGESFEECSAALTRRFPDITNITNNEESQSGSKSHGTASAQFDGQNGQPA